MFFSHLLFFLHCNGVLRSVLISLCAFAHCSQHDSEKWFVSLDLFAGRHKAKRHNIWRQSTKPRLRGFLACALGCCLCFASRFISALPPYFFSLLDSFTRSSHPPRGAGKQQQVQVGPFLAVRFFSNVALAT